MLILNWLKLQGQPPDDDNTLIYQTVKNKVVKLITGNTILN